METYTNADYVELESLSPLSQLAPGATATHTERWQLFANIDTGQTEDSLHQTIAPLIEKNDG
jgi:hypothetical protein